MQGEALNEDDDGLGYYPDGVKRTLTNEQIAMFRHSEIYSLLRERQLLKENSESDDETHLNKSLHPEIDIARASTTTIHEVNHSRVNDNESNEEEEYVRFLDAERNNNDNSNEDGEGMNLAEIERENTMLGNILRKRKIGKVHGYEIHNRPPTHRRIVRELDDVIAQDDILDYGDEPSGSKDTPKNTAGDALNNSSEPDKAGPTVSFPTTRSDVKVNGSNRFSNKAATATSPNLDEHQYKAVYNALKNWRERVGPGELLEPTSAEVPDVEDFLSHACIEDIAECASNLHSTEDFHGAAVHWDKELVNKYAEELMSIVTKALADPKESPMQGRKIWWPEIRK